MSSLRSTSKVVGQLIRHKSGGRRLLRCLQNTPELENSVQSRWFRSIGNIETLPSSSHIVGSTRKEPPCSLQSTSSGILTQRRGFLGCGDGDEGSNVLSKIHEEKRIMGYSPEQLFAVVAAVDMYQDFLPWCQRSDIIRRHSDSSFDAELEIGFKFLVESYVSHVQLVKPKMVKTTSSQSSLFDHLINVWEFNPGPVPGTCDLHFFVDFKFQSPLYSQMASMFFKEVVSRLVTSFNDRCRLIYGPGVQVTEKLIERRM
ncbi:coenzyme Q-binding protein [Artemisia annua]|uniref:Coenzyme Q-binding protein n=1 Tax=Artemisia annua TaxID=35608 RepID=A0A2U1KEL4_ARTAN|nr:coenzyme Q-binding protein [Artemisia annua]